MSSPTLQADLKPAESFFGASNDGPGWQKWVELNSESPCVDLAACFGAGKKPALGWGLAAERRHQLSNSLGASYDDDSQEAFRFDSDKVIRFARAFVAAPNEKLDEYATRHALPLVGVAQHLPQLAANLEKTEWVKLFDRLYFVALENQLIVDRDPVESQYLSVELALTLAALFPEWVDADVARKAISRFARSMEILLDVSGVIGAEYAAIPFDLLGIWTRSRKLMGQLDLNFDSEDDSIQFEWFVRQCLKNLRPNRSPFFSANDPAVWSSRLFRAALAFSNESRDHDLFRLISKRKTSRKGIDFEFDEIGVCSEWSRLAVLQDRLKFNSNRIAVAFDESHCRVEICNRSPLVDSNWEAKIRLDQVEQKQSSQWVVNLWHQDDDVELLEIESQFDQATVQRSFLLCRQDAILVVADAVLLKQPAEIEYELTFQSAADTVLMPESETNEVYLTKDGKLESLLVPLYSEEWQNRWSKRHWRVDADRVDIKQTHSGTALFVPMLFDMNPKRCNSPRTWRRLAVAEALETCSPDRAVGYRYRNGDQQWLIYRSLEQPSNRTVLGQKLFMRVFRRPF